MKKLLLVSAIILGATAASQAGVHFGFGVSLPFPPLPVVVAPPAPVVMQPAPVYVTPAPIVSAAVCAPSVPVVVAAPAPVVIAPRPVYYYPGPYYHGHHGWGHTYGYRH